MSATPAAIVINADGATTLVPISHKPATSKRKFLVRLRQATCLEMFMSAIIIMLLSTILYTFLKRNIQNERFIVVNGKTICVTKECVTTAASLLNVMDQSVDPCEDFFQFACGTWNKQHPIPDDRSSISTFEVLSDKLQHILSELLQEPIDETNDNGATAKAKTLYQSCINTTTASMDTPLRKRLLLLGGWPVTEKNWQPPKDMSLERLLGVLRGTYDMSALFENWISADDRNSSSNVLLMEQPELLLHSREYYLKESSERDRNAYLKLMVEIAMLMGAERNTAEKDMKEVLQLETRIANVSIPEEDRHDAGNNYNMLTIGDIQQIVPNFNWTEYFEIFLPLPFNESEPLVVYTLPYFRHLKDIIATTDRRIIQNYCLWRIVFYMSSYITGEYASKRIEFLKVSQGVNVDKTRWQKCVEFVAGSQRLGRKMSLAVGSLFIRDNFDPESKRSALEMIHNIRQAFSELLEENDWMDEETREVAREKANAMNEWIGYPEMLENSHELSKEYELLDIREGLFLDNAFAMLEWESKKTMLKFRTPVQKGQWTTGPAVVNAFYNPNKNDIVFPAGILQPFFYSSDFPKSLNYGGVGVVIGHEITHGFDDKGRQFDKDGNMKQWWNNQTIQAFRERAQCMVDQYSSYVVENVKMNVNGKMTQGENIADNGGLKQAYRAYRHWVKRNGEEPLLPGVNMTHDQLFFLNFAQIWCGSLRPEEAINKIRTAAHSPGHIRVLGPLSNSMDFANAYNCAANTRMNPKNKCSLW